jgi:hypothetical protein
MVRIIFMLFALIIPGMAGAGTCQSNYCEGKIVNLYTNGFDGLVYVKIDGNMSMLNCTLHDGYINLKQDNLLYSEIYSSLLAAAVAQANIRLRIEEGSVDCKLLYTMLKV